jgi:rhodanese-related sulfurtransferase
MSSVVPIVTPGQLHAKQLAGKSPALVDVRTAGEYRAGHIPEATLIPGEELSPETIEDHLGRPGPGRNETLYITCHAGPRAARAAETLRQSGLTNIALVEGGTQRWEQVGLPLQRCGSAISLERQVQIAIGSLLILKVVLGYGVHELFFAAAAFIGAGLIFAGVSRWCGMSELIARLPWNRSVGCPEQAQA